MRLGGGMRAGARARPGGLRAAYVTEQPGPGADGGHLDQQGEPITSDVRGGDTGDDPQLPGPSPSMASTAKNPDDPGIALRERRPAALRGVATARTDGRGVEGVDVPYRFTGSDDRRPWPRAPRCDVPIDIVRHQAKLEPPLSNITGLRHRRDDRGRDALRPDRLAGQSVSATGSAADQVRRLRRQERRPASPGARRGAMRVGLFAEAGLHPAAGDRGAPGPRGGGLRSRQEPSRCDQRAGRDRGLRAADRGLPDTLNADGVSQAAVQLVLRDLNGQARVGPVGALRTHDSTADCAPYGMAPWCPPRARRTSAPSRAAS